MPRILSSGMRYGLKARTLRLELALRESATESRTGFCDGFDYARLERLEFFLAQGAVGGLEGRADEERIIVRTEPGVAEDFGRSPLDHLRNLQRRESLVDALPRDTLVQYERKVAAHWLEA